MNRCFGRNERGEPCGAARLVGGSYCLFHDPEYAEAVQAARNAGGLRRKKEAAAVVEFDLPGLASLADVRRLLEVAAIDTLRLPNSVARNKTLSSIGQAALQLIEKIELDGRIEGLESALDQRRESEVQSHELQV